MSPAIPVEMVDVRRKDKLFLSREQIDQMSSWMAHAVISRLSEDLEDLNAGVEFRTGFQRCCAKMLVKTMSQPERVLFYHEAIPGFTAMVVKRDGWALEDSPPDGRRTKLRQPASPAKPSISPPPDQDDWEKARAEVVEQVISSFVSRTGNRVLSIEAQDVVVILFPASDLKKNLQDMGFWFA